MTGRSQLVGLIQRPGEKPQNVELTVSPRPVLTSAESAAGLKWVDPRYEPGNVLRYGPNTTPGTTDMTVAFQNAALSTHDVIVPDGSYLLSDEVLLNSNQSVYMSSSVTITQSGADKNIFKADTKDNVWIHCNGAILVGEGTWSDTWTGMSGHEDRAIQFITCTNSGITDPVIKDCGACGIALLGGDSIRISNPTIIGTHNLSTVIGAGENFQLGIFVKHDPTEGSVNNLTVTGFDISDTAQGIVVEGHASFTDDDIAMSFQGICHDIPGQHGMYIQAGGCNVGLVAENCNLSALKIQSGSSNHDIKGFDFRVNASNCGSQAVELATTGTGWISGVSGSIVAHDCQRGLGISDKVRDADIFVQAEDMSQHGIVLSGANLHNLNLRLICRNLGRYGFLADCTSSDGINLINPIIREANDAVSTYSGIEINASGSSFNIFNPEVTDSNTNQVNGIFVIAGTVGIYGKVVATGASSYGVRANVALDHWPSPEKVTLSGTTAAALNTSNFVRGPVITLADDATPSIFGADLFKTGGTTTITDFDDGAVGQTIKILAAHSITITDNASIILNGGANFAMVATDTLTLTMFDDQVWQEISRSVN